MKMQKALKGAPRTLLAIALALATQVALAGEVAPRARKPETVRVTAPRLDTDVADTHAQAQMDALIEKMHRRFEQDLLERLDAIGARRIELVVSEVSTRG